MIGSSLKKETQSARVTQRVRQYPQSSANPCFYNVLKTGMHRFGFLVVWLFICVSDIQNIQCSDLTTLRVSDSWKLFSVYLLAKSDCWKIRYFLNSFSSRNQAVASCAWPFPPGDRVLNPPTTCGMDGNNYISTSPIVGSPEEWLIPLCPGLLHSNDVITFQFVLR